MLVRVRRSGVAQGLLRTRSGSTGSAGDGPAQKKYQRSASRPAYCTATATHQPARRCRARCRSSVGSSSSAGTMKPAPIAKYLIRARKAQRPAVHELARVERAAGHAHRFLHHLRVADAGGRLQVRLEPEPAVASDRQPGAPTAAQHGQRRAPSRRQASPVPAVPVSAGERGEQHQAGGQSDQGVVDQGQRMRPFLDEPDAGVDHRRAVPEHQAQDDRQRPAAPRPGSIAGTARRDAAQSQTATSAMNAGSTITSRDSHDVRHISTARQARSGRPRCRKEAPSAIDQQHQRDREAGGDAEVPASVAAGERRDGQCR